MSDDSDRETQEILQDLEPAPPPRANFFAELRQSAADSLAPSTTSVASSAESTAPPDGKVVSMRRRFAYAVVTCVTVAAVFVLLLPAIQSTNGKQHDNGNSGNKLAGPTTTVAQQSTTSIKMLLAAQVLALAEKRIQDVKTLSAQLEVVQSPYYIDVKRAEKVSGFHTNATIRLSADGSWYLSGTSPNVESGGDELAAYRADTGTKQDCFRVVKTDPFACSTTTGHAEQDARADLYFLDTLSYVVRDSGAHLDDSYKEVDFENRKVWQLHSALPAGASFFDDVTILVDEETNMPLQITTLDHGQPYSVTTLHNLVLDTPFTVNDFMIAFPKGHVNNAQADGSFRRVAADALNRTAGYAVPLPASLPGGFTRAETSYAADAGVSGQQGENKSNRSVVEVTYRRGLQRITVTYRLRGAAKTVWVDPLAQQYEGIVNSQDVSVVQGAFKGTHAHLVTTVTSQRMWGASNDVVFTIEGDISSDEMKAAVDSM